jgi:hypothetical protein
MDEQRARSGDGRPGVTAPDAYARFRASTEIDYEKWHDGVPYDLEALGELAGSDRDAVEAWLIGREPWDWRDIQALAALDSAGAREALRRAAASPSAEIRVAVLNHAPHLVPDAERAASLVRALEEAEFYGGLTAALDQVAAFHPPEVIAALWRGARHREGEVACHLAAMLLCVGGLTYEAFDWEHRPFLLRFNTPNEAEREAACQELRERLAGTPAAAVD